MSTHGLGTRIGELRTELKATSPGSGGSSRADMAELKAELKADIAELRAEVRQMRSDLTRVAPAVAPQRSAGNA